jgi:hypothetical protein
MSKYRYLFLHFLPQIGIPYPNTYDMAVKEKMNYNNKYEKQRNLLSSSEWLRVQAYR